MAHIGIIGGTAGTTGEEVSHELEVETRFGAVLIGQAKTPEGNTITTLSRHGKSQRFLSHMINHRAHIEALRLLGVEAILATTSCGVIDSSLELGRMVVFDDLYFPDNRLPGGEPCSIFTNAGEPGRGHLIASSHFSANLRRTLIDACEIEGFSHERTGCYGYALGPRFNSKSEIRAMRVAGCTHVSQTAGPEAVLAAELEIPYALIGFGTDYANGVATTPTPIETLNENIAAAGPTFARIAQRAIVALGAQESIPFDTGFVYRFE